MTEEETRIGRPPKHTEPLFRFGLRVNHQTKAGIEAVCKEHNCTQSEAVELMNAYRYYDPKQFHGFAKIYFKRGLDFALSPDGRAAVRKFMDQLT